MMSFNNSQIQFQFLNIQLSDLAQHCIFSYNIPDLHRTVWILFIIAEWDRNKVTAIQFLTYNSGTKCIPIQSHHQIQHCSTVICFDHLRIFIGRQNLFSKIKGTVIPLFKSQTWITI